MLRFGTLGTPAFTGPTFRFRGAWEEYRTVAGFVNGDYQLAETETTTTFATRLTLAAPIVSSFRRGDLMKIISNAEIPYAKRDGSLWKYDGEFFVLGADGTNDGANNFIIASAPISALRS